MATSKDGVMDAQLVWDGGSEVIIPTEMGTPREDQMVGTVGEQLSELAGRVCYDSLGRGRSSEDYHAHLIQVGHGSVFEHYTRTLAIIIGGGYISGISELLPIFLNRQGIWVEWRPKTIRLTMNIRSAFEWLQWSNPSLSMKRKRLDLAVGNQVQTIWHSLVPELILRPHDSLDSSRVEKISVVEPESDHEKWVSLYMVGSRGFSHEQVRHGNETAISQRSTRYVQESESPWVMHPLVKAYMEQESSPNIDRVNDLIKATIGSGRRTYDFTVSALEKWLLTRIPESDPYRKQTARKQARGAARGYLGNALQTEMVFSASVAQWRHMIRMRAADAADAEIRTVFNHGVPALKTSRYGDRFEDISLVPASDGLGLSLAGGGAE